MSPIKVAFPFELHQQQLSTTSNGTIKYIHNCTVSRLQIKVSHKPKGKSNKTLWKTLVCSYALWDSSPPATVTRPKQN